MSIIVTARGALLGGDPTLPDERPQRDSCRRLEQTEALGLIGHRVFGNRAVQQAIRRLFEERPVGDVLGSSRRLDRSRAPGCP